jgi:3-oxoacyl-[acyl-carrier-protein] synthase II
MTLTAEPLSLAATRPARARSIAITGLGLITPLGPTAAQTWAELCRGAYITDHSPVPCACPEGSPRVNHLAQVAACEALASAGWSAQQRAAAGIVVGTSKGPAEHWLNRPAGLSDLAQATQVPTAALIGETAATLAAEFGMHDGTRLTISAACASGLHALIRGAMLIRFGEAERVLVVAAEASVHPLFLGSFRRLGLLPRPGHGCRPFDQDRAGFLMSEAAAAVCLEGKPDDLGRHTGDSGPVIAQIDRFQMGGDATHLTGGDPHARALSRLLRGVVAGDYPDLIHAHGTGTRANDAAELAAIESAVVGAQTPAAVYSHKGALGHSLGAAGLVSVVINCLSAQAGTVPPNVRTTRPIAARHVTIERAVVHRHITRSIAIAAGFGGSVAVLSLQHGI